MKAIIILLRPHQWLKNLFVFLPLFFNGHIAECDFLFPTVMVFFAFSFAASSIYCFNDIWDMEADRLHLEKCGRPIASGVVSKGKAYGIMTVMIVSSLIIVYFFLEVVKWSVTGIILCYYLLNILYCIKLKYVVIIDVFIIAVGFVLRVFAGGIVTGIFISQWLILMTFLFALFLAFAKRRDDVAIYVKTEIKTRKNTNRYNLEFMNQVISIIAAIIMVCYIMYTVSDEVIRRLESPYLYITSVFVLAGIIRYLQLTIVDVKSGSPTKVLIKDIFIQLCVMGWIIAFLIIIYL
jgi:4-hydroxybenzoate polyprenyltransferase